MSERMETDKEIVASMIGNTKRLIVNDQIVARWYTRQVTKNRKMFPLLAEVTTRIKANTAFLEFLTEIKDDENPTMIEEVTMKPDEKS